MDELTAVTHDQGNPTSPAGECYLLTASWPGRGGKPEGISAVGVFATDDQATEAILGSVASSIGYRRVQGLVAANRMILTMRTLEPSDLEQMAALVRQHRAAQA